MSERILSPYIILCRVWALSSPQPPWRSGTAECWYWPLLAYDSCDRLRRTSSSLSICECSGRERAHLCPPLSCALLYPSPQSHANAQDVSKHRCARSHPARSFFFPSHRYTSAQDMSGHICACPYPVCSFPSCAFPSCTFLLPLSSLHERPGHERAHLCLPLSCALIYPSPLDLM